MDAYQKVIDQQKDNPWAAEALFHKGLCLDQKGQTIKAQECYKKIVENFPDTLWSREAAEKTKG